MKSLAELNANPVRRKWEAYTLETTYAVGGMGRSWAATHKGAKFHFLTVETVVERDDAAIAARDAEVRAYQAEKGYPVKGAGAPMKIGHVFSCYASCNGNGQHTGIVARGYDTDAINCKNCNPEAAR